MSIDFVIISFDKEEKTGFFPYEKNAFPYAYLQGDDVFILHVKHEEQPRGNQIYMNTIR